MKKLVFLLMIFLLAVSANYAQKIKLRNVGFAKISLTKGSLRSTINLEKEAAGCPYISGVAKSNLASIGCAAPPASFQLVDATVKNNQIFVVVSADAMGNCNVCSMCGASEAFSVIWLKLDKNLQLVEKKSVPIELCRTNVALISNYTTVNENDDETLKLPFKNDVLTIEFEKTIFNDNADISGYEFSHLEYNRKTPEKGFVIKTETRGKSSMPEGQ